MAGRPQKFTLVLSDEERSLLKKCASATSEQVRRQQRAKILLLRADGRSYEEIQSAINVSAPTITKVLKKAQAFGAMAALDDLQRSGRPTRITREAMTWLVSLACQMPDSVPHGPPLKMWTITELSKYAQTRCKQYGHPSLENVQRSTVWEILNNRELKPHRVKYYLERKDPEFESEAKDVLILYKRIEWITQMAGDSVEDGVTLSDICGEVFVSYDEKPGIQAISNIDPDLPPTPKHGYISRDYEYRRKGTISLLAGIDLFSGNVHGIVRDKYTSAEFIEFLTILDSYYDENHTINIILDNHSIHKSQKTMDFITTLRKGRFNFVFTPKHGSWLNLVECFFIKFTRQALRFLRVESVDELKKRIEDWLKHVNDDPVVFRWKAGLEDIENAFRKK